MEVDFVKLVGKRILASSYPYTLDGEPFEYSVLDFSPSGKFVKLENAINGNQCWKDVNTFFVVEVLRELRF
jgi:hypothetical protein